MSEEKTWEQLLVEDFPLLFNKEWPVCGISVSAGWRSLVWDLCADLEGILVAHAEQGNYEPMCYVAQIKQKFGGLRFYHNALKHAFTDEFYNRIKQAEQESFSICEKCSFEGKLRVGGWTTTLCEHCYKSRYK